MVNNRSKEVLWWIDSWLQGHRERVQAPLKKSPPTRAVKNFYTKSERLRLLQSDLGSERLNLCHRQIMTLPKKTKA